jgi:hypothetical protein
VVGTRARGEKKSIRIICGKNVASQMIGGCWNPSKYSGEKTPFSQHMYIVRTNYLCTLNRAFGMHNAKRTIVFLNFKNM